LKISLISLELMHAIFHVWWIKGRSTYVSLQKISNLGGYLWLLSMTCQSYWRFIQFQLLSSHNSLSPKFTVTSPFYQSYHDRILLLIPLCKVRISYLNVKVLLYNFGMQHLLLLAGFCMLQRCLVSSTKPYNLWWTM
jgi:hypothetical protein